MGGRSRRHAILVRMANPLARAKYLLAAHNPAQLPPDGGFEVAFAGRSNAGKSTALNAICQQNALARVSKTPGRTQQLVFFDIPPSTDRYLVDLPGYGYAKVPQGPAGALAGLHRRATSAPARRSRAWWW